jgi:hypothetical protein
MLRAVFTLAVVLAGHCAAFSQSAERQTPIRDPDVFEFITLEQERPILDSFARGLLLEEGRKGYILVYAGRNSCKGEARRVIGLIVAHMAKRHGLTGNRIIGVDGGYRDRTVYEMWSVPYGEVAPVPTATVDPNEIKSLAPNSRRCRYLRAPVAGRRRT